VNTIIGSIQGKDSMIRLATISFEASVKGDSFGLEISLSTENLKASGRTHADFLSA
jgi:hypothetical protein